MTPLAFLPSFGAGEILVVGFIALLVFGNRLPSVMRSLGKSVTEFKKGVSGVEDEIDGALNAEPKKTPRPQEEKPA
jgi:sec-independent protein translocase protein TatA